MSTSATRNYVRHCGDVNPDVIEERERQADERREALLARQEAFRAMHPELAKQIEERMNKR